MSNYFKKLAASIALVGALATGGCSDGNENNNEADAGLTDAVQCITQENYGLNVALTNYETGIGIEDAIVRAEWGEKEGKVCPFDNESKFYTCNQVPGDLDIKVSYEGINEIYSEPIDVCGEQSQTKEYFFNAPTQINDQDAGSIGDVFDAGTEDDASIEDDASTNLDAGSNDTSSDDASLDAGFDDAGSDSDVGSDADVGPMGDAYDAGTEGDAAIVNSCTNLNEFPDCMGPEGYTTLVTMPAEHLTATNLGYEGVTQDIVNGSNAAKKVFSGNACSMPVLFEQPDPCTGGLVVGQATVELVDDNTIAIKRPTHLEGTVALEKLIAGGLNGTNCTITIDPNDPENPNINCQ